MRVANSVNFELKSHINETRLSLSIMKTPLSRLSLLNAECLYVLLSAKITELEEVDDITRLIFIPVPLVAITMSVAASISLYFITFPSVGEPPEVENDHIKLPDVSSKLTVLRLLK